MKKKVIITIASVCTLLIVGTMGFFLGKNANPERMSSSYTSEENKETSNIIAVVNMDEGTAKGGTEKIYYGEKVVQFPNDSFVYTSLEDARRGIENNTYAAYIIIPSTFSDSVESLNTTPTPANLQYALSNKLKGDEQANVLYQVLSFGRNLNTDISYMYLANILQEFHNAQNQTELVMSNDLKDKEAMEAIQTSDIVQMVSIPELQREENNTAPVDITGYMDTNRSLVRRIQEQYQINVEDTRNQIETIGESTATLDEVLKMLSGAVGEINLTTDESGVNIYKDGLVSLAEKLTDYNNSIADKAMKNLSGIEALEMQRASIEGELNQSIATYNQKLEKEVEENLTSYGKDLRTQIPSIICTEVKETEGMQYELSCSQIEGEEAPPVITFTIVDTDSEIEKLKQECVRDIMYRMSEAANNKETEEVIFTVTEENPLTEVDPTTETDPPVEDDPSAGEERTYTHTVNKSLLTILAELDEDEQMMEKIERCGYGSTLDMLTDYVTGNLLPNSGAYRIEMKGELQELEDYIKSAFNIVNPDKYIFTSYEGNMVDDDGKDQVDEEGHPITVNTLFASYKALIENMKPWMTTMDTLDQQGVTDIVTNACIFPMVDRTEKVKENIQHRYAEETMEIKVYQKVLDGYHPTLDTSQMSEAVTEMNENNSEMQQNVNTNNQTYVDFVNKVYATTQENTMALQAHVQEAKDASTNAVTSGLAEAKNRKEASSQANQQAMAEFAAKLPFTRLGTMEYTQVYEFIANPLQLTAVSDYQRLKEDISNKAGMATSKPALH